MYDDIWRNGLLDHDFALVGIDQYFDAPKIYQNYCMMIILNRAARTSSFGLVFCDMFLSLA